MHENSWVSSAFLKNSTTSRIHGELGGHYREEGSTEAGSDWLHAQVRVSTFSAGASAARACRGLVWVVITPVRNTVIACYGLRTEFHSGISLRLGNMIYEIYLSQFPHTTGIYTYMLRRFPLKITYQLTQIHEELCGTQESTG